MYFSNDAVYFSVSVNWISQTLKAHFSGLVVTCTNQKGRELSLMRGSHGLSAEGTKDTIRPKAKSQSLEGPQTSIFHNILSIIGISGILEGGQAGIWQSLF